MDLPEFEVSLVNKASSRTARATQRNPVSETVPSPPKKKMLTYLWVSIASLSGGEGLERGSALLQDPPLVCKAEE